jgi:DNA-binding MarR family transcriptional regulator
MIRSAFLVNAAYTENSRKYGFSAQQGQVLCVLRPQPFGMGELGTVLGLAKSSVTGLVDRLERAGLVRREPSAEDSRAIRVALTGPGREAADEFYTETRDRILRLSDTLTEAERETLAELLGRVAAANNVSVIFP